MSQTLREVDGRDFSSPAQFLKEVAEPCLPVVMRGLVSGWPAVHAATRSAEDFQHYLAGFDNGSQAEAFVGDSKIAGKYYYAEDLKGFNFERRRMRFADALTAIVATHGQSGRRPCTGSLPVNDYLPGFAAQNVLRCWRARAPRAFGSGTDPMSRRISMPRQWAAWWPGPGALPCFRRRPSRAYVGPSTTPWRVNPSARRLGAGGGEQVSAVQQGP
jgi:hypothetical protein